MVEKRKFQFDGVNECKSQFWRNARDSSYEVKYVSYDIFLHIHVKLLKPV